MTARMRAVGTNIRQTCAPSLAADANSAGRCSAPVGKDAGATSGSPGDSSSALSADPCGGQGRPRGTGRHLPWLRDDRGPAGARQTGLQSQSQAIQRILDGGLADRLPVTFSVYTLDRIKDWQRLFPAERNYFERLFGLLDRSDPKAVEELFAPLVAVESKMGIEGGIWKGSQFTLEHVDFLQRNRHLPEWRAAIAAIFAKIDPILDGELVRSGTPRMAIVVSPPEIPMGPDRMWMRIREQGRLVHLQLEPDLALEDYLPLLLTGSPARARRPTLFDLHASQRSKDRFDTWVVEASDPILRLARSFDGWTGLSFERMEDLRSALMRQVNDLVTEQRIPGPRQLGERLQKMNPGALRRAAGRDPVMREFLQSVLLNGNGTLLINNTFVEWTTLQAIRRARPSLLLASFGIRNKVKPFSSLLIYADQEVSNPIPTQSDMLGSYVDLEVYYQYIWQECEKYAEYRRNTAYLFVGIGMDALLAIAPPDFPLVPNGMPKRLKDIFRACAACLRL